MKLLATVAVGVAVGFVVAVAVGRRLSGLDIDDAWEIFGEEWSA